MVSWHLDRSQWWRQLLVGLLVSGGVSAFGGQPTAEPAALLMVQGAVHQRLLLDRDALARLSWREFTEIRQIGQASVTEQVTVRYQGVPLREILDQAMLAPDRRAVRRTVVVLTAKDGYQTVFSWGELYNSRLGEGVILVRSQDDRDLLQDDVRSTRRRGAKIAYKTRYDNFIGGQWVAPVKGQYFDVITPVNGKVYTQAHAPPPKTLNWRWTPPTPLPTSWGKTDAATRSNLLLKIADRIEAKPGALAYAETVDNGKAIRETLNADIPLAIDHFRYFAGCVRAQEGGISEIDENTMAYHIHEPLGVVGQIIPWNFPILMAAWKLAPALGAGNCVVLKPAESTPISILILAELIADLLPPGVLNIVNGYGREAGMPLATSKRIAKIAFTGSTTTGRVIAQPPPTT
jgi:hypothetical protein